MTVAVKKESLVLGVKRRNMTGHTLAKGVDVPMKRKKTKTIALFMADPDSQSQLLAGIKEGLQDVKDVIDGKQPKVLMRDFLETV